MKCLFAVFILLFSSLMSAQETFSVKGRVLARSGLPAAYIQVGLLNSSFAAFTDSLGRFEINKVPPGNYSLVAAGVGYLQKQVHLRVPSSFTVLVLAESNSDLNEIVVTGTMKEVHKDESPVNIDVITPALFQKTSTPNLFEATALVNGVKPQINCNVCNTGDIHINGLEGPYTLVLIDGMPIVSGLSSVYGLMGIPASMIERLEIAKGPAGALYGSEAMGGTINLITKKAALAPRLFVDYYGSSYGENNLDLGLKTRVGKHAQLLTGLNGFYFDNKVDVNRDGFTDVTLQKRVSLFNKINFERNDGKEFSVAARVVGEDRWGGQMNWEKRFRGGDSVYGESIYAKRAELISKYEWPVKERITTQLSYNIHDQNSVYGDVPFIARQSTAFAQTFWSKHLGSRNELLAGATYKNLWYDDNTGATITQAGNNPDLSNTAGIFLQNESTLDTNSKHKLLLGCRLDYNQIYKFIPSPRLAYKWSPSYRLIFRVNFGTGFRIVNVFTEDHAALTGAREVVFVEQIRPERSLNVSLNAVYKMKVGKSSLINWDASLFYYHFSNKIFANYDLDPEKVIYRNLEGFAFSRGGALNASLVGTGNFKFTLGATCADVQNIEKDSAGRLSASRQLLSPLWSGNIIIGYHFPKQKIKLDVTGQWYGPQRLPVFPDDYRPEYSPWFCLLNLQVSKVISGKYEIYAGGKNLLNYLPRDPIMRPFDPFDKYIDDENGNPNGYTFDPSYSYAPMQTIRFYVGVRITID